LQETKSQEYQLPLDAANLGTYASAFADATVRKGYSGVAIYTKRRPERFVHGFGWPDFDAEGRYVQADLGAVSIGSIYVPSGSAGPHRREWKWAFLEQLEGWMKRAAKSGRSFILCGDFNLAHDELDVHDPKRASKMPGFLPQDCAWLDRAFHSGWVDALRRARPGEGGIYTWWAHGGDSFARNLGWRIDFQIATAELASRIARAEVYTGERFSDHAPVIVDYDLEG
jgi:exodeoxyribonuclease-3